MTFSIKGIFIFVMETDNMSFMENDLLTKNILNNEFNHQ